MRMCNNPCSSGHVKKVKKLKKWKFKDQTRCNAKGFTPVRMKRTLFSFNFLFFEFCEGTDISSETQNATRCAVVGMFPSKISKIIFLSNFGQDLAYPKCNNPCSRGHVCFKHIKNDFFWAAFGHFFFVVEAWFEYLLITWCIQLHNVTSIEVINLHSIYLFMTTPWFL